jgi:C-terminal processing protease CtpA/Prc
MTLRGTLVAILIAVLPLGPVFAGNNTAKFGGVGIDGIQWADGRIAVKQLVTGGPAQQAGIRIGDIITHIDGKPTTGSDFGEMVNHRLRGRAGTKVNLTIRRPGQKKALRFTLVRRELVTASTSGAATNR